MRSSLADTPWLTLCRHSAPAGGSTNWAVEADGPGWNRKEDEATNRTHLCKVVWVGLSWQLLGVQEISEADRLLCAEGIVDYGYIKDLRTGVFLQIYLAHGGCCDSGEFELIAY